MNLYKKCTAKPYSFLAIDATLVSDNLLCFRKNLLEKIQKLIMANDDTIRDEIRQYNINRKAAELSVLSSGKVDRYKYEYFTSEEILPPGENRVIKVKERNK